MKKSDFPKTVRGFYWLVIKHFPLYFWTIVGCGILRVSLNMIYEPLATKWMIQIFENAISTDWGKVISVLSYIIATFIAIILLAFVSSYIRGHYAQIFNRYKLLLLYERIYQNDINFFIDIPGGQTASYAMTISSSMYNITEHFFVQLFGTLVGFVAVVGLMFSMNFWFVVILFGYGVLKAVWEFSFQGKLNASYTAITAEESRFMGIRNDSLNNALVVKYFANQKYENMYIYHGRDKLIKLFRDNYFLSRFQWMPTDILWRITQIGLLIMCFFMIKHNMISISDGAYLSVAATTINSSFDKISDLIREYSVDCARVTKAYNSIIVKRKIVDKPNAKKLHINRASIEFENVDFAYSKNKVLKNFNLKIKPSERVGIVGLSGAGKTTLCNLLLRMWDVKGGAIKVDGNDIRDVKHDSLLQNISYVPQDITLFNRTIMENIQFAKPNATKAQVINAAKKANIHDFIVNLPNGYDTIVGNNGIKLSGGERQRISIARALLKNAPILVLDEATSALDSKNEIMVQKSLKLAMRGKTTLVIAHRLSTLRDMDRIIVIKNGQIIETGSQKQLLRKRGAFYTLWTMQTAGFIA